MTANNWLAMFIAGVVGVAVYMMATRPPLTLDELDELDEEWWG